MGNEDDIILKAEHLRKDFGGLVAVEDVCLQVQRGTLHTIIGPNGAGKTTLFNLLSGRYTPTSGRIYFQGRDVTHTPASRRSHLGIGRSFQITNIFPNLTVLENVRIATQSRGGDNWKLWTHYRRFSQYERRALEIIAQVGLQGREALAAQALPHGDKRKLEIGILLATEPLLLLLDEPTAGLSRDGVPAILEIIRAIRAEPGRTIILVEHKMDMVMNLSDRITVMHLGKVIAEGTPAEVAANATVQTAYLGGAKW